MPDDPWQAITGLRQDVRELRALLDNAIGRISELEADTPHARQLQLEADLAAADLAESGCDRHGRNCQCPYCSNDADNHDDYDPGPGCDDQGGMPGYQHRLPDDGQVWQP
jgi:hypothetical protein